MRIINKSFSKNIFAANKTSPDLYMHEITNKTAWFQHNPSFKLFGIPLKHFIRMTTSKLEL